MWNRFEHVGLGVGYNFTDFSSELRFDSDYSEYGWLFRIQGKYQRRLTLPRNEAIQHSDHSTEITVQDYGIVI